MIVFIVEFELGTLCTFTGFTVLSEKVLIAFSSGFLLFKHVLFLFQMPSHQNLHPLQVAHNILSCFIILVQSRMPPITSSAIT